MAQPGLQEKLYHALRDDFLAGAFPAGTKINLRRYTRRYSASMTPVREAAFRLVGEQLFEPHPQSGFRIYLPAAAELHALYAWNGQHLLAALHGTHPSVLHDILRPFRAQKSGDVQSCYDDTVGLGLVTRAGELFRAIGMATGNKEYALRIEAANHRLHYLRLAETRLFKDYARELDRLVKGDNNDVENNVRRRILTYHRRRIEQVGPILQLAQSSGQP